MARNRDLVFRTAVIQWQVENTNPHRNQKPRPDRYVSQFTGADMLLIEEPPNPDEVSEDQRGKPWTYAEFRRLITESGEQWSHIEGNVIGQVRDLSAPDRAAVPNARAIGLIPEIPTSANLPEMSSEGLLQERYFRDMAQFQTVPGPEGKLVVTGERGDGVLFRWILDPDREFAPLVAERIVRRESGGEFVTRVATNYAQVDGRWFPLRAEISNNGVSEWVMTVTHAEFDRPYHPDTLHIGEALQMLPGTNIMRQTSAGWSAPMIFDGEMALPVSEAVELEKTGILDTSAFRSRLAYWASDTKGAHPKPLASFEENTQLKRIPGRWEDYTRAFIRVYRLNPEQTGKAWSALRECQNKAQKHLDANRDAFRDIQEQKRLLSPSKNNSADPRSPDSIDTSNNLALLAEREERLLRPLEVIFNDDLRPSLFSLLSPRQRQDGEARLRRGDESGVPGE
ncbi:MAG: hypothetical protein DPW13_02600 [Planctomycetes bacterium]|nr:hypothetical protein [Planctomycetota bacterium]